MKKHTAPKLDLSQDAIVRLLTPDPNSTIRTIYTAYEDNVQDRTEITIHRDSWYPQNPSASTKKNLASLVKKGIVTYDFWSGYCLSESYLESHGYLLTGEKLAALNLLYQDVKRKLARELSDLYRWNRIVYLSHDSHVARHWSNSNDFDWIEMGGTYQDYTGRNESTYVHTEFGIIAKARDVIDTIVRWEESVLQAVELEIARVEYQQDVTNRRAYYARLAGK